MISRLVASGVDAMLPALPAMRADLAVELAYDSQLVIAMLMLGLGVGRVDICPLTDRFGRRPIFAVGCLVFVTGSVICVVAADFYVMLLGRLIQGLGLQLRGYALKP